MIYEWYDEYDYGDLLDDGGVKWKNPVAIYPKQVNARMRAQRGWFTIHGSDRRPLDVLAPERVAKIILEPKAMQEAGNFLTNAGVSHGMLFPDLDGLARELNEKNGI
jgi:Lhr-like helicase